MFVRSGRLPVGGDYAYEVKWDGLRAIVSTEALARLTGHADAGFTLRTHARDGRDKATMAADVLARAAKAQVGS